MADNFFVVRLRAIASQQDAVSWLNVLTSTKAYMQPLLAVSPSPHPHPTLPVSCRDLGKLFLTNINLCLLQCSQLITVMNWTLLLVVQLTLPFGFGKCHLDNACRLDMVTQTGW